MRRKRIVHVIPSLGWGGAETLCVQLCNGLSEEYEVTLICLFDYREMMIPLDFIEEKVQVVFLGKRMGFDSRIFIRLFKWLHHYKPDIVHSHTGALFYLAPVFLFHTLLRREYIKIHTIQNLANKEVHRWAMKVHNLLFRKGIVTPVAISDIVLDSTRGVYGDVVRDIIVNGSHPPVVTAACNETAKEIAVLKPSPGTRVLLNIGRLSPQKNQLALVLAMSNLKEKGYDIILLIIGGARREDKIIYESLVASNPGNVYLLGNKANIGDYLKLADAFCLPSHYEGLPLSLVEAMSLGVIPVCTPVGGIPELVIEGHTGFLAEGTDVAAITNALENFLQCGENQKASMQQHCRKLYEEKYSIEICVQQYKALYER